EPARSEKGEDLRRFALDRRADGRVVHEDDAVIDGEPRERRLELERLLHRLVHERLDDRLAPRAERAAPKAAAEAAHAGEAHAAKLPGVAVERVHADVAEHLANRVLLVRLEVVI